MKKNQLLCASCKSSLHTVYLVDGILVVRCGSCKTIILCVEFTGELSIPHDN